MVIDIDFKRMLDELLLNQVTRLEFDTEINILNVIKMKIELTKFSESIYFNRAPVVGELRPQHGFIKALEKPEYAKLKLAVEDLINVEKECWDKNCPTEKIKEMTKNYYEVFGEDFPSLADKDCQLDEQEINDIKLNKKNLSLSYTRKCITNLYYILKCPLILYEKDFGYEVPAEHMRDLCGKYNSSLLYAMTHDICKPKNYNEIFGININSNLDKDMGEDEGKTSLETLFNGQAKYPYNYNEFNILLEE